MFSRGQWMPVLMFVLSCPNVARFFTWPVFPTIQHNPSSKVGSHSLVDDQLLSGLCGPLINTSQLDQGLPCSHPTKRSAQTPLHLSLSLVKLANVSNSWCQHTPSTFSFITDFLIYPERTDKILQLSRTLSNTLPGCREPVHERSCSQ
jgi:hypothetical protein